MKTNFPGNRAMTHSNIAIDPSRGKWFHKSGNISVPPVTGHVVVVAVCGLRRFYTSPVLFILMPQRRSGTSTRTWRGYRCWPNAKSPLCRGGHKKDRQDWPTKRGTSASSSDDIRSWAKILLSLRIYSPNQGGHHTKLILIEVGRLFSNAPVVPETAKVKLS